MEATRNRVIFFVKFAARVQHGHDDFQGGTLFFWMLIHGNTPAIVRYCNRSICIQENFDAIAMPPHGLVNAVVNDLPDQMVQTINARIANVHRRAFLHCFKTLENLNIIGCITIFNCICHV